MQTRGRYPSPPLTLASLLCVLVWSTNNGGVLGEGSWGEWGMWMCSVEGVTANRTRTRVCEEENCTSEETQTDNAPVVVEWSQWSEWLPVCNASSSFQQSRSRSCAFPPPDSAVCESQCGSQNRTVTTIRVVPLAPCCEDLPLSEWSEWSPSCSELVCDPAQGGACVWGGVGEGNNVSAVNQSRQRERENCTVAAEQCPDCENETQTRIVTVSTWGQWGAWQENISCLRVRERECEVLREGVEVCQLCTVGETQEERETVATGNPNCTESSGTAATSEPSSEEDDNTLRRYIIFGALVAIVVVALLFVLMGVMLFGLWWRELRLKRSFDPGSQRSHPPGSARQPQLVFANRGADREGRRENGDIPLTQRRRRREGIPQHPLQASLSRQRAPGGERVATRGEGVEETGTGRNHKSVGLREGESSEDLESLHSSQEKLLETAEVLQTQKGSSAVKVPRSNSPGRAQMGSSEVNSSQEELLGEGGNTPDTGTPDFSERRPQQPATGQPSTTEDSQSTESDSSGEEGD